MRAVHNVAADYGGGGFVHVLPYGFEQAGIAGFGVGGDLDGIDRDALVAGLDDRFHAVAELGDDVQPIKRVFGIRPKTAGGIRQICPGGFINHAAANALQEFLERRKMFDGVCLTVANDYLGLAV